MKTVTADPQIFVFNVPSADRLVYVGVPPSK